MFIFGLKYKYYFTNHKENNKKKLQNKMDFYK